VVGQINNQNPTPEPTHEQKCVHLKECLLEVKQFFACEGGAPKKLTIGDKIVSLSLQRVRSES
jgi:hypothetical protein